MDNRLGDWKRNTLIPAIWDNIERAFPELHFRQQGAKWVSSLHLDGSASRSKDQTYIAPRYGNIIGDNSGEKLGFLDYVMRRDNCDLITAEKTLAAAVGVDFPEREETPAQKAKREREEQNRRNKEATNRAYTAALFSDVDGAKEVLSYLIGRGWTKAEIKEAELGYIDETIKASIPDASDISYSISYKEYGDYTEQIGVTHRLTIPFKNRGEIIGFKFRNIHAEADLDEIKRKFPNEEKYKIDKYLNSKGDWRSGHLYALHSKGKDCVVVEGELDALHAIIKGAKNVVATTGGALTYTQVEEAVRAGFSRFTLLFDTDERGQAFISPSIKVIHSLGASAWIAYLPDGKDVDEYLKAHTIEEFNDIVAAAEQSFYWELQEVVNKYTAIENSKAEPGLSFKERDNLFNEFSAILNAPTMKPIDRRLVKDEIGRYEDSLRFTLKEFEAWADKDYYRDQERKRAEQIKAAYEQIADRVKVGDMDGALKLMRETADTARDAEKAEGYAKEFAPLSGSIDDILATIREGIPTGYMFEGNDPIIGKYKEELSLNVGLTFIAAPTSHGKTSFLNNIALNVAEWNRANGNGQTILYFSYEVDRNRLIANLLNTYINDPDLSKIGKPLNAIYDYGRNKRAAYFSGSDQYGEGSHYAGFLKKKAEFEKLLKSGAICISDEAHKAGELIDAIRFYLTERKPTAIFIDYAQLIYDEDNKGLSRTEELKKIMNALKELTKRIQTPIVLAAQMKNDVTSPIDVTIDNVGESKDLAMIADTTIGLFNFGKLHPLPDKSKEGKVKKLIKRLTKSKDYNEAEEVAPIRNEIYAKIIKRRFGLSDIDQVLQWEGKTGYITPNNPEALKAKQPEQGELFPGMETQQSDDCPF